jgi:hypothetical protein
MGVVDVPWSYIGWQRPLFFTAFIWHDGESQRVTTRSELVEAWKRLLAAHDLVYCAREDVLKVLAEVPKYLSPKQQGDLTAAVKALLEELDPVLLDVEKACCEPCVNPLTLVTMGFDLFLLDRMEVKRVLPQSWEAPGAVYPKTFDPVFEQCRPYVYHGRYSVSDYLFRCASNIMASAPVVEHPWVKAVVEAAAMLVDTYFPMLGSLKLKKRTTVRRKRSHLVGDEWYRSVLVTPTQGRDLWRPGWRCPVIVHLPDRRGAEVSKVWVSMKPDTTDRTKCIIHPGAVEALQAINRRQKGKERPSSYVHVSRSQRRESVAAEMGAVREMNRRASWSPAGTQTTRECIV